MGMGLCFDRWCMRAMDVIYAVLTTWTIFIWVFFNVEEVGVMGREGVIECRPVQTVLFCLKVVVGATDVIHAVLTVW